MSNDRKAVDKMKVKEMDMLIKHMDRYFEQTGCSVLHPIVDNGFHIDVLLYKPSEKYPFWKLVTMGASDYKMPKAPNSFGRFNEYIMFVDGNENLEDMNVASWFHSKLIMIASYAKFYNTHISYGHSLEWQNDDPEDKMIAAFIEMPQVISNVGILHCKVGMFKTVACLQTVLLNKNDLDKLMEIGPQAFSNYLYPENNGKRHFLSERRRSENF